MPVTVNKVQAEARAASFQGRSIKGESKRAGLLLALSMIDLTTLEGKDTVEKVRGLCRKAVGEGGGEEKIAKAANRKRSTFGGDAGDGGGVVPAMAAVCVYPAFVKVARAELDRHGEVGRGVKVASVATGFPSGQYPLSVRIADTRAAVADGADEIDMVINRGAFLAGRYAEVAEEIREVKRACVGEGRGDGGPGREAHLKVILETGELETYDHVRRASDLAIAAMDEVGGEPGFIKTSTGKVQPAATMPVTLVMLEAIRDHYLATGRMVGMKPAGGIATAKLALQYLVMVKETLGDAWLTPAWFRFGASSLANDILRQLRWVETGVYSARYDFSEA